MFALLGLRGWLIIGLASALIIGGGLFYWHYRHLETQAALAEAYKAQIEAINPRLAALDVAIAKADADRQKTDAALTGWQNSKAEVISTIRKEARRAAASTNPACAPSLTDRQLRNDAIARLVGPDTGGAAGGVPPASSPPH